MPKGPCQSPSNKCRPAPIHDPHFQAMAQAQLRSVYLGSHAAGAQPIFTLLDECFDGGSVGDLLNQLSLWMQVGVLGVNAVNIGDQHEEVGLTDDGYVGGEFIVITEDDLIYGNGIILVDDGNVAKLQQLMQGVFDVLPGGVIVEIAVGEQALRYLQPKAPKHFVKNADELRLADSGQGLFGFNQRGTDFMQFCKLPGGGNSAGGHQDDIVGSADRQNLPGQVFDGGVGNPVAPVGQGGSTDLDDDFLLLLHKVDPNFFDYTDVVEVWEPKPSSSRVYTDRSG